MKSPAIAEKPSVIRDIARISKCGRSQNGAIEGDRYIVTRGLGHLIILTDPEGHDKEYKERKTEDLPIPPNVFKLEVAGQTAEQYHAVRIQIHRKDVGFITIATNIGREGKLAVRLILKGAGSNKPMKRPWISSVTDKAIREGFANLRDGRGYDSPRGTAMCRVETSWMVGINATRALTYKYNAQFSCGRVRTPTLVTIVKRGTDTRSFIPKPFYGLQAKGDGLTLTWQNQVSGSFRTFDKDLTRNILEDLEGETGVVSQVRRIPKKAFAPLFHDLTELQRDANKRFDYSARETLNIMQRSYEDHKVLTYPRADSRYLSSDIIPTLKERLKVCIVGSYRVLVGRPTTQALSTKPFFVDNSKVSDRRVIIPTEQFVQLDHMTIDERRIYDLVVRRFLAVIHPPSGYEQANVSVQIGGEGFIARGKIVKEQGRKAAYDNGAEGESQDDEETAKGVPIKERQLPDLKKGDKITALSLSMTEGKTEPPAPFNEVTLLSAMENPAAYMESRDKVMVKILGETGRSGTVAAGADIIEKLFFSLLPGEGRKDIYLTSKTKQLLELVPEDLEKPGLIADQGTKLSRITKGDLKRGVFISNIRVYPQALIGQIRAGEGNFHHGNLTNTKCPVCGKRMLIVKGKNSEMLVCQDREHGYRETTSRTSNAYCPVCHRKMELRDKGEGQIFVCRCGHKERLFAFRDRGKKEGADISKRDVANYSNQQNKEVGEPINNTFTQALSGIKLGQKLKKFLGNSVSRC